MTIIRFEREQLAIQRMISTYALDRQVSNVSCDTYLSDIADNLVVRISRQLYVVPLEAFDWKYPRDWIQAFKDRWFPKWLLKRFPVQYRMHQVDLKICFPDWINQTPKNMGEPYIMVTAPGIPVGLYEVYSNGQYRAKTSPQDIPARH